MHVNIYYYNYIYSPEPIVIKLKKIIMDFDKQFSMSSKNIIKFIYH